MALNKSRKPVAQQKSISSFFLPMSAPASGPGAAGTKTMKPTSVKKNTGTPEKIVKAVRTIGSFSQRSHIRSGFEEPASSDTSFASPEVDNFRNPILKSATGKVVESPTRNSALNSKTSSVILVSDGENEKENKKPATQEPVASLRHSMPTLKRAATSNMLDFLNSKPKKVKKQNSTPPPATPAKSKGVHLSDAQLAIVDAVVKYGENVFFTGSAGTGKSVVLRMLVAELHKKHGPFRVGVTASTGLAACNIKGQTIHKFLSIGLGTGSPNDLATKIKKNPMAKKRWTGLRVLLIDEISMIDGRLFSKIDEIAKIVRNSQSPFGGIQIVCCGDFFQLPPVCKEGQAQYCFNSSSWKRAIKNTMILTKVFRQEGDNQLIDMLNALREGSLDEEMLHLFHSLNRKVNYTDGIEPTELFPTRHEVKRANEIRLQNLKSDTYTFVAIDNDSSPIAKRQFDNLMCEEILTLKVGAQVMYLKNHPDNTVVNGSIGRVIGFLPEGIFARFFSLFHPNDFIDASPEFLSMISFLSSAVGATTLPEEQRSVYNSFPDQWKQKLGHLVRDASLSPKGVGMLPVINFKTGDDTTLIQVKREEFIADQGRAFVSSGSTPTSLVREQLPLLLSWAMSIHKSQGQSIDRLRVDLRRTFEKGQIYVALSRATNKEQLEVYNFDHRRITVSKEVQEFYKSLKPAGA